MIIDIFKTITSIPRCSGTHKPFIEYMKNICNKLNYLCIIDKSNNILCKKENSTAKLIFQSHYDIVCLSDNCIPKIIENSGILSALNSTLGSDNGIGCAYMIALMHENFDAEYLFTSDEEIGLIGANNFNLPINANFMLNLDSEKEGEICIGCAGGVDIIGINTNKKIIQNIENLDLYEITLNNLPGGHSGVDIDKDIPNAIKLIVKTIKEAKAKILDINGGERINSIPANAKAIVASKNTPKISHEKMIIKKIDTKCDHLNVFDDEIINFIYDFSNGAKSFNENLNVVQTSINLATIKTDINCIKIELSARSMSNSNLEEIKLETVEMLKKYNFSPSTNSKYSAWEPTVDEFTNKILEIYKKFNNNAKLKAIHAGLECAIFKNNYSNLKIASIGPTINFPHSKKEEVSIKSINNVFEIIKEISNSFK